MTLKPEKCHHPIIWIHPQFGAAEMKKGLMEWLKYEVKHCPICGGLTPELGIWAVSKTYTLTCYEIREFEVDPEETRKLGYEMKTDRRVIDQTDYEKLCKYHIGGLRHGHV